MTPLLFTQILAGVALSCVNLHLLIYPGPLGSDPQYWYVRLVWFFIHIAFILSVRPQPNEPGRLIQRVLADWDERERSEEESAEAELVPKMAK